MLLKLEEAGTARHVQEDGVEILGEKAQREPAATGTAAEPATEPPAEARLAARRSRRRRVWITLGVVAALLVGINAYAAYELTSERNANAGADIRPSGIPRNISTSVANLMQISSIPGVRAPGFTFTDQRGRTTSLASLRGKVVVLGFMDSRCADLCPVMSKEFIEAHHLLGARAGKVVFAVINVDQRFASVRNVALSSTQHHLTTIPDWHFLTGPGRALQAAWHDYHIVVDAPNPVTGIVHTSTLFFIGPGGAERFLALPMVGYTAKEDAAVPPAQISAWASGIARLAGDLARS